MSCSWKTENEEQTKSTDQI
uniref:Uncharacterized protein n=1 Tax=Arundo donax TaxID=35708 RepID=A0A0A9BQX3_ARUDO